jgi:hypothetical protein
MKDEIEKKKTKYEIKKRRVLKNFEDQNEKRAKLNVFL